MLSYSYASCLKRCHNMTDEVLLRQGLGLSSDDTQRLRTIWEKLRDRRVNRKPASSTKKDVQNTIVVKG